MDRSLDVAQRTAKSLEHEEQGNTRCSWYCQNDPHKAEEEIGQNGNRWNNWNHPDYSIAKIGMNTEKSPGDMTRLVAQTLVKDHQQ